MNFLREFMGKLNKFKVIYSRKIEKLKAWKNEKFGTQVLKKIEKKRKCLNWINSKSTCHANQTPFPNPPATWSPWA